MCLSSIYKRTKILNKNTIYYKIYQLTTEPNIIRSPFYNNSYQLNENGMCQLPKIEIGIEIIDDNFGFFTIRRKENRIKSIVTNGYHCFLHLSTANSFLHDNFLNSYKYGIWKVQANKYAKYIKGSYYSDHYGEDQIVLNQIKIIKRIS